jgi:hypothetical protein
MKCSKDKKSLNEKMLCFVTSIPHVGHNHINIWRRNLNVDQETYNPKEDHKHEIKKKIPTRKTDIKVGTIR